MCFFLEVCDAKQWQQGCAFSLCVVMGCKEHAQLHWGFSPQKVFVTNMIQGWGWGWVYSLLLGFLPWNIIFHSHTDGWGNSELSWIADKFPSSFGMECVLRTCGKIQKVFIFIVSSNIILLCSEGGRVQIWKMRGNTWWKIFFQRHFQSAPFVNLHSCIGLVVQSVLMINHLSGLLLLSRVLPVSWVDYSD